MAGVIEHEPYDDLSVAIHREIAALQARAYDQSGADADDGPLHDSALHARSFMLWVDGHLASYAGVVTTTVEMDGLTFAASGLSCVATDPGMLRRGYASRVVAAATRWIGESNVDLGLFTCAPQLSVMYGGAGSWQVEPGAVLIGSRDAGALTSTQLGVVVLMWLRSPRAIAHAEQLRHGTIDLGLSVGQFW